jgi:uncharacterized glyoxalase superfamily protein PhnB
MRSASATRTFHLWRFYDPAMSIDFLDAIPVLPCVDIRGEHDFLVDVVGLESAGLIEHDNKVIHGEVRAGDRRFWLHESAPSLASPSESGVRTGGIVLHVADVDSHFDRVRAAGATILREPTDEDYGQREYGLRDPEGHDWYIATPFASPAG